MNTIIFVSNIYNSSKSNKYTINNNNSTHTMSSAHNQQLTELRSKYNSPHILFFISRSKNANIVVYEGKLDSATGQLDSKNPVIVYWLDIDPAYVKKNRSKGITSDRSELNTLENNFAYGLSSKPYSGNETKNNNGYKVELVALPSRAVYVYTENNNGQTIVKAYMIINGKPANIQRIYVKSTDRMIGLPKVDYVEVEGVYDDGSKAYEKITP